ncbi:MAG: hypothetical protein KAI94_13765 [Anaerolineales bacterium]|nr:hypothetical protein [Anaerolineales bacterium]
MITERKEAQITVESESYIYKMLEKYYKSFLGNRLGEVENGEIYSQAERRTDQVGEEVRSIDQLTLGG